MGPLEDMSRGMQQKVAIARAFLTRPVLLLLDEPTTGLDPRSKREVQAFVRELREVHDATIVLTTHDMYEAEALCDRIAILDDGRIVALDTPAGLKKLIPQQNGDEPTLEDVHDLDRQRFDQGRGHCHDSAEASESAIEQPAGLPAAR